MEDLKQKFMQILGKGKKNQWAVFLVVGLIFLIISIPSEQEKTVPVMETETGTVKTKDKAEILEERLETVLSKVSGVGKTSVLITLKSDGQKLVEKDETISSRAVTDQDTTNGSTTQENSREETTIYEKDGSGSETPYVTEQKEPEVLGVLVVAEGGGDATIVSQITEAVQALFSIEVHKIKVMKMN